ncbi:hypothetical protein TGPRC2_206460 [Toxoplasma gondii TgCatPRC2]|uniref:Uncharacterized protein n=4 Tax=Toxoplasma gondii TaxID=5811 RepID=A0A151H453_TOXGO|nr:hypothetical protein TGME49_206460 [Toxoplasma gondii ME49]EPT29919.1 hypothetical protein TGME49_206460 [Toxoplasma gondii ME49]KYF44508.1 hypothetical protein TGARI_206460 [Toxoplasma gondii ARI]KYK64127.1 hypothetical protein TGPRC2_206460 [Toxoplasma gondii TgCatPRC2]PIM02335.1 hypothetical protein TGCOUG_206460 [Toxoplasma gondii COUG]|eukprot:XP_018637249.1 hypothetical protein TGME49_206460 [Toxoplasma gondii ME49]
MSRGSVVSVKLFRFLKLSDFLFFRARLDFSFHTKKSSLPFRADLPLLCRRRGAVSGVYVHSAPCWQPGAKASQETAELVFTFSAAFWRFRFSDFAFFFRKASMRRAGRSRSVFSSECEDVNVYMEGIVASRRGVRTPDARPWRGPGGPLATLPRLFRAS